MQEEAAQDLGDREDEVPVRNGPEHMPAEPLAELHGPFLPTAGAEFPLFAGEREDPFGAAGIAADAGKTCMQVAALQVVDHDLLQVGPPESVALLEPLGPERLQALVVVLPKAHSPPVPCFSQLPARYEQDCSQIPPPQWEC